MGLKVPNTEPPPEFGLKMTHLSDDDAEYQAYGFLVLMHELRTVLERDYVHKT